MARGPGRLAGLALGAAGVLIFSFTFPAAKLALRAMSPWFAAGGRGAVAAGLAALVLAAGRAPRPSPAELARLAVVAAGVVVGFPLLSSLALRSSGAAHGAVVVALLPAATAAVAVVRAREAPGAAFWLAAGAGAAVLGAFTVVHARGSLGAGDAYLVAGVAVCAVGYAEGGALARRLGGPNTICWALVLAAPVTVPLAVLSAPRSLPGLVPAAGFLYTCGGSMLLGFFAWYAGLARGGVARVSQVQLVQTPITLLWSALVLGEHVGAGTAMVALAMLACVAATQRARVRPVPGGPGNPGPRRARWPGPSPRGGSATPAGTPAAPPAKAAPACDGAGSA